MRLEDKKAIVTGAAQGLGKTISLRLALEGADVLLADIKLDTVRDTAKEISNQSARKIVPVQTDVTNEVAVREMVKRAVREFGRIDLLVANAGILISGPSTDIAIENWRKVIDVNLTGYFLCAREVAKQMIAQGYGNIIQINSKSGKKGSQQNAPYASSKFGGIGLTQSLALELAPELHDRSSRKRHRWTRDEITFHHRSQLSTIHSRLLLHSIHSSYISKKSLDNNNILCYTLSCS